MDPALAIASRLLSAGATVLDIGAHVGNVAAYFATVVGPRGFVHAFEPNLLLEQRLSLIARRYPNISYHPYGLSNAERSAELHIPYKGDQLVHSMGLLVVPRSRTQHRHYSFPISLKRLDDIIGTADTCAALIKCDVEGHELEVLEGAMQTLSSYLPALLIEIEQRHQDRDIQQVFDFIRRLGYVGFGIRKGALVDVETFDVDRDQLSLLGSNPADLPPAEYVNNFLFVEAKLGARPGWCR